MTTWMWAILLRPFVYAVLFVLVIAPIIWVLYRVFPEGRLKVILFKERSGPEATSRDKRVMTIAGILACIVYYGWLFFLIEFGFRWPG